MDSPTFMKKKADQINKDKKPLSSDTIDVLIKKSSVSGETDTAKEKKFKFFLRKAYTNLQDSSNEYTKVIMEIVASAPNVNIIFLPNEVNIREYKEDGEKPECKTDGITFVKTELIIIAAKEYENRNNYRKFLGVIIHEFCHFAVHETFGNGFKPYYIEDDEENSKKWEDLVKKINKKKEKKSKYPAIQELFDYDKTKWVNELVVRYPQMLIEHHGTNYLRKFKKDFLDLHKMYTEVNNEFKAEKEKTASIRTVNAMSLLGNEESKLYVNTLVKEKEKEKSINFDAHLQIVKTNQTHLVMKCIFDCFEGKLNFKSKFMFIRVKFLKNNIELIKKALQCKKISSLIIDCHDDAYEDENIQENLFLLINSHLYGHIILILNVKQVLRFKTEKVEILFETSDLNTEFKGSVEIDFQGSKMPLKALIQPEKFDEVFNLNEYLDGFLSESQLLIGHQMNDKLIEHYVERCFEIKRNETWEKVEMNESQSLRSLFARSNCLILANESGDGKSTESIRIYERIKNMFPDHWVVLMNLSNYIQLLDDINHSETPYELLSMKILKKTYEKTIFLELIQKGKVFFIFDSLDEVCPKHLESMNVLVKELETKNKVFVLTRPFALNIWGKINFIQIRMADMNINNISELVEKVLKSRVKTETVKLQNQKENIIEFLHKNDLKTPLLVRIVTSVYSQLNNFDNLYKVYEKFIQKINSDIENKNSEVVIKETLTIREIHALLSEFAFKRDILINEQDPDCFKSDKKEFADHFFSGQEIKEFDYPLLRSGIIQIIRDRQNSKIEFVHKTFEIYFIATFIRDNCKKICEDDRFLNILCLVALNLELNDRLKDLVEFLKGSENVENLMKKLSVFNQLLSSERIDSNFVNIGPVPIELSKQEKSLQVKYLTRFKDPVEKLDQVKLKTLAQCGFDLPFKYFISHKCFKEHFLRNTFLKRDVSTVNTENLHIVADFAESLNILSNNPCEEIIQLFLEQHKDHLDYYFYRKMCTHDFLIELFCKSKITHRYFLQILSKFCEKEDIEVRKMFDLHEKYFLRDPLLSLFDINQVDFNMTYNLLNEISISSRSLMRLPLIELTFKFLERDQNGKIIAEIFNFISTKLKVDEMITLISKRSNISLLSILQLIQLSNLQNSHENFDEVSESTLKLYEARGSIQKNLFDENFLRKIAELISASEFNDRKLLKLLKMGDYAENISKILNFTRKCERIENLEIFLEIIREIVGKEDFVNFVLWKNQYFMLQLPNFEHYETLRRALESCDSFKSDENYSKFSFVLSFNSNSKNMTDSRNLEKKSDNYSFELTEKLAKSYNMKLLNHKTMTKQKVECMNFWGEVLKKRGMYSKALEKFESALNMCTDDMIDEKKILFNNAAECCHILKNYDKAIEFIQAAQKFESDTENAIKQNARSMNLWGDILKHQKNFSSAIEKYENAARMSSDQIELRSTYEQKERIEKNREPIPKDVVDILKEKSSIVGVNDNSEKLKFSSYIRKAYTDIQDAFNGRTKVIMEIVVSVPDVKIIYLPNEDNIHNYEDDLKEKTDFILEGITYAKSETIIIAAKGYDVKECSYRKFLGVIIHEFCHFAVHEIFGNKFKPYYADDKVAAEKWKKLVEQYELSDLIEFPVIKELFNYEEINWIDELVVRYPQIFVEHHGSEYLHKVEENFMDLHSNYITRVHKEFELEKEKIKSLQSVNKKSLLGYQRSKIYVDSLEVEKTMKFETNRQIVITNHTHFVMRNIFNISKRDFNFKSKDMFIEIKFLESDENIELIDKAMQCRKKPNLIIDGHDDAYENLRTQENLSKLFNNSYDGRIILILHKTQSIYVNQQVDEIKPMIFKSTDLTTKFKGSLKVNFQGSELSLEKLVESSLIIEKLFEDYFEKIISNLLTKEIISVGNQLKITHDRYLEGKYEHEKSGSRTLLNLNDDVRLVELFEKNPHIIINWISSKKKVKSESMRMCMRLKSVYPDHWIVHIDFSCSDYPLIDLPKNESDYLHYFLKEFLRLDVIESEIFQHFIDIGKVIFIFEGIDINIKYNFNNIKKILIFLANLNNKSKICLFTRPDEFHALKDEKFEEIRLNGF